MQLVGFVIRIYHEARSPERQIKNTMFSVLPVVNSDFRARLYTINSEYKTESLLWSAVKNWTVEDMIIKISFWSSLKMTSFT